MKRPADTSASDTVPVMVEDLAADFVIVGSGSAGAPLATRIAERSTDQVLVLEAGPKDKGINISIPAAFSKQFRS